MSIRKYRRSQYAPMLDLTGASDIIFTLLLFYILSQNFLPALEVNLPELKESQTQNSQQEQFILIKKDGTLSIKECSVSLDQLKKDPEKFFANLDSKVPVIVKTDAKAPAECLVRLMELMTDSGFKSVSFLGLPDGNSD